MKEGSAKLAGVRRILRKSRDTGTLGVDTFMARAGVVVERSKGSVVGVLVSGEAAVDGESVKWRRVATAACALLWEDALLLSSWASAAVGLGVCNARDESEMEGVAKVEKELER